MANSKYEYVKSFEVNEKLMPFAWIVVRIDGCHFRRFTEEHKFDKPNDIQGLNLMNACAVRVLQKFPDIVFAYGISDEYSFVLKKTTEWYERRSSKISHVIATSFSSLYTMKWKEFFPEKELKDPPCFDGRVVCYPSTKILRDYLAWRQVDCHINNQYNTCFWMLVKSGKSKAEAQEQLKGTQTEGKNELLFQQFGINYNTLPAMFRKGSCVFRDKVSSYLTKEVEEIVKVTNKGDPVRRYMEKVVVGHNDIIDPNFWGEHPHILGE